MNRRVTMQAARQNFNDFSFIAMYRLTALFVYVKQITPRGVSGACRFSYFYFCCTLYRALGRRCMLSGFIRFVHFLCSPWFLAVLSILSIYLRGGRQHYLHNRIDRPSALVLPSRPFCSREVLKEFVFAFRSATSSLSRSLAFGLL